MQFSEIGYALHQYDSIESSASTIIYNIIPDKNTQRFIL